MSLARGFLSGLSLPQALNVLSIYMLYWGEEISLRWVQFDLLASRDLLRWFCGSELW